MTDIVGGELAITVSPESATGSPQITTTDDNDLVRRKRRAVAVDQAMRVNLQMAFLDEQGLATDLTGRSAFLAKFQEATYSSATSVNSDVELVEAASGTLRARIPASIVAKPGVYVAEIGILNEDEELIGLNRCYVLVRKNSWAATGTPKGPPDLDSIRLSLRDNDFVDNELIDAYGFDLAEICTAITQSVLRWNETPPDLARARYNTQTFPYRDIWLVGIRAYLFNLAEEYYRRNHLQYNAGNTSIDDKNRHREYGQAFLSTTKQFIDEVQRKKVALNIAGGFGIFTSPYY